MPKKTKYINAKLCFLSRAAQPSHPRYRPRASYTRRTSRLAIRCAAVRRLITPRLNLKPNPNRRRAHVSRTSQSSLNAKLGKTIDGMDFVVRFNYFQIKGSAARAALGTKTAGGIPTAHCTARIAHVDTRDAFIHDTRRHRTFASS